MFASEVCLQAGYTHALRLVLVSLRFFNLPNQARIHIAILHSVTGFPPRRENSRWLHALKRSVRKRKRRCKHMLATGVLPFHAGQQPQRGRRASNYSLHRRVPRSRRYLSRIISPISGFVKDIRYSILAGVFPHTAHICYTNSDYTTRRRPKLQ